MVFQEVNVLKPGKQRFNRLKIYGFDVETYDENRGFVCASLYYDDNNKWIFYSQREFIDFLKLGILRNVIIACTNLSFDFFQSFFNEDEVMNFNFLFRGSNLLYAKTYLKDGVFVKRWDRKCRDKIVFIDTSNYARLKVEKMGSILNIPKLEKPDFLGEFPKSESEWAELKDYNMRDSEISCKFLRFLYSEFENLGATPKLTIASTAMSLFRNKYLDRCYERHDKDILEKEFLAYYGGRTEAFARGRVEDCNFYDINSLYPYVMRMELPDPESMHISFKDSDEFLRKYNGISHVSVECPHDLKYPLLPFRTKTKLLFPSGSFEGWYVNAELRKALQLGYKIVKVFESHYYTKSCFPFRGYVDDLYKRRLEFGKSSPMGFVVKLLLNSLYGKFGQKFKDRDNWEPNDLSFKEIQESKNLEVVGRFVRIVKDCRPANFCVPLWASHITCYARLLLYDYIVECEPYYVDTDSVMTKKSLVCGDGLGMMKLEGSVSYGIVVKPKMYALRGVFGDDVEKVKVKGLGLKLAFDNFLDLIDKPDVVYKKFSTFKEAIRRGLVPGELADVKKSFGLEDSKREWKGVFDPECLEFSRPVVLVEGLCREELLCLRDRFECERVFEGDVLDSKGVDVGDGEFVDNEAWFECF